MPPKSKTKTTKSKGVDTAYKETSKKAAKWAQARAALQQDMVNTEEKFTRDVVLTGPLQGMANHMDNMMAIILELSQKVHGQDTVVAEQICTPLTSP